jgi:glycogen debranching enzyme
MHQQPFLHDLLAAVHAPTQVWSGGDGQVRPVGAQGVFHGDTRVASSAVVRVAGVEPEPVSAGPDGVGAVHVAGLARTVDGPGADPTARLDRFRRVRPGRVDERLVLSCSTAEPVRAVLTLALVADATPMEQVKAGMPAVGVPGAAVAAGAPPQWASGDVTSRVVAAGAAVSGSGTARDPWVLAWELEARTGAPAEVGWALECAEVGAVVDAPSAERLEWSTPRVRADDRRLPALVAQALDDLAGLRLASDGSPDDVFLAAGAPWFFTLFGRDSLWAARMLLPLGTDLAAGTLRTLARRQGVRVDPATAEQPGKILHEVRRSASHHPAEGLALPPVYYGTVDATPLWVTLLHDAWRWGMAAAEVEALLPAAESALAWMADHGDADGDGFLEYVDESGRGLANQGWKDSGDSVQWRDGRLATGPIALCEVQGYAHEAALAGAALLDAFGRPGADRWRAWAASLAERFRAAFWVRSPLGDYPGIALDRDKAVVDTLTSNAGHLIGTGLLTPDEEGAVARRLAGAEMDGGRGLRTMAADSAGYWPLRYHGGAVWPHDTAIVVAGLARAGRSELASSLTAGLLRAAEDLQYRLPELWSGDALTDAPRTVPYPAACRPQAWSAAAGVAVLGAALGLRPDVPGGTLTVEPLRPSPFGAVAVEGLRVAGHALDVAVDAAGAATVRTAAPLAVTVR